MLDFQLLVATEIIAIILTEIKMDKWTQTDKMFGYDPILIFALWTSVFPNQVISLADW